MCVVSFKYEWEHKYSHVHALCINHLEFTVTAIEVPTKTRTEDVWYLMGVNLT